MRPKATIPQPKEHEVQKAIVDALRLCGFVVQETTAYRQKGASGVDKGIPDLLVWVPGLPCAIGLEVKPNAAARIRPEQLEMVRVGAYEVVCSVAAALDAVLSSIITLREAPDPQWDKTIPKLRSLAEAVR